MKNCLTDGPLVSVVIPVYNREGTIERAVNSVLNQTYTNIELIVVDDGSTDNSLQVVKQLQTEQMKIWEQVHLGANAARNFGISVAKGEYIAFQDSDDEWLPEKLEKQITYMLENNFEACYCPFFLYGDHYDGLYFQDYRDRQKYENNLIDLLRIGNVLGPQTLVIHRNIISDVGNFDEEMPRLQDYEFAIRIAQKKKIGYVNEPLVKIYRSDNSISNDEEKLRKARHLLLKKHGDFCGVEKGIKNFLGAKLTDLNESDIKEELERIDRCLKENWRNGEIDIYKCAGEVLFHRYRLFNKSCFKEYELHINKLQSHEFAIYGAGNIGKQIYLELAEKNLIPQCFLVTEKWGDEMLFGIPIIEVDKWNQKNTVIIIGVSHELQFDLIQNLIRQGYTKYFRCPYW